MGEFEITPRFFYGLTRHAFPASVFKQSNLLAELAYLIHMHRNLSWGRTVNVPPPSLCLLLKNTNYALYQNHKPIP